MRIRPPTIDSIRKSLVGLRVPRALEARDAALRRIEQGEIDGIEVSHHLLLDDSPCAIAAHQVGA
ncbi:hypothetical protein [Mesorhizobium sp.]|uniref:hypothetical protein n=1 Tax=Mesorhizobium sp. TaxID=1871066 RepID=UPI00257F4855|nr:hypothetical protein [Mesorhizobium sp.]